MNSLHLQKKFIMAAILCVCALTANAALAASQAQAHRLNVYAWLENDQVLVECDFGKSSPARGAHVKIIDSDTKKILLQGLTDASGRFAFTVPAVVREGHGLTIDVNSGQGHHGEWNMDASELYAAASLTAGFDQAAIETEKNIHAGASAQSQTGQSQTPQINLEQQPLNVPMPAQGESGLTQEHVRAIVNDALDSKLSSLRHELAAKYSNEPGIGDIIGGIGWIIGIVGIYLYFRSRRK